MSLENELKKLTVAVLDLTARLTAPDADVVTPQPTASQVDTAISLAATTPIIPVQPNATETAPPIPNVPTFEAQVAVASSSELKFEDVQSELGQLFQTLGESTQIQEAVKKWGGGEQALLNQVPPANFASLLAECRALVQS